MTAKRSISTATSPLMRGLFTVAMTLPLALATVAGLTSALSARAADAPTAAVAGELPNPMLPVSGKEQVGQWATYNMTFTAFGKTTEYARWIVVTAVDARGVEFREVTRLGLATGPTPPDKIPEGATDKTITVRRGERYPILSLTNATQPALQTEVDGTQRIGLFQFKCRELTYAFQHTDSATAAAGRYSFRIDPRVWLGGLMHYEMQNTFVVTLDLIGANPAVAATPDEMAPVLSRLAKPEADGGESTSSSLTEAAAAKISAALAATRAATAAKETAAADALDTPGAFGEVGKDIMPPNPMRPVSGDERVGQWVKYWMMVDFLNTKTYLMRWIIVKAVSPTEVTFRDVTMPFGDAAMPPETLPPNTTDKEVVVPVGKPYPFVEATRLIRLVKQDASDSTYTFGDATLPCRRYRYEYPARTGKDDELGSTGYALAGDAWLGGLVHYEIHTAITMQAEILAQNPPFPAPKGGVVDDVQEVIGADAATTTATTADATPVAVTTVQALPISGPVRPAAQRARVRGLIMQAVAVWRTSYADNPKEALSASILRRMVAEQLGRFAATDDLIAALDAMALPEDAQARGSGIKINALETMLADGRFAVAVDLLERGYISYGDLRYTLPKASTAPFAEADCARLLAYVQANARDFDQSSQLADFGTTLARRGDLPGAITFYNALVDPPESFAGALLGLAATKGDQALADRLVNQLRSSRLSTDGAFIRTRAVDAIAVALNGLPRGHALVDPLIQLAFQGVAADGLSDLSWSKLAAAVARHGRVEALRTCFANNPAASQSLDVANAILDVALADDPATARILTALMPETSYGGVALRAQMTRHPASQRGSAAARAELQRLVPLMLIVEQSLGTYDRSSLTPLIENCIWHGFTADAEAIARQTPDPSRREKNLVLATYGYLQVGDVVSYERLDKSKDPSLLLLTGDIVRAILAGPAPVDTALALAPRLETDTDRYTIVAALRADRAAAGQLDEVRRLTPVLPRQAYDLIPAHSMFQELGVTARLDSPVTAARMLLEYYQARANSRWGGAVSSSMYPSSTIAPLVDIYAGQPVTATSDDAPVVAGINGIVDPQVRIPALLGLARAVQNLEY